MSYWSVHILNTKLLKIVDYSYDTNELSRSTQFGVIHILLKFCKILTLQHVQCVHILLVCSFELKRVQLESVEPYRI